MPVYVRREYKNFNVNILQLKKWLNKILKDLNCEDMELSILLVNDEKIRKLNAKYRKINKATDVLSFSQIAPPQLNRGLHFDSIAIPEIEEIEVHSKALGDVVISADTAARQAQENGLCLEMEYRRLMVHGILHLLGHDHVHGGRQAANMKREEERLLTLLNHRLGAL